MSGQSLNLVSLFCVGSGKNGDCLGTDEEQIVQIIIQLYDCANNKVLSVQEFLVKPSADDISETVLTEECKVQTGLTERDIKNGQSLEQVIDEVDRFLRTKEIHPQQGGRKFCFCADGPLHLRMALHPEAFHKNITLPAYYYKYFDLRKQFKLFYKPDRSIGNMEDMLSFLALSPDQSVEYGQRHCQDMARIIHRLLNDGHCFSEPETIMDKLEPGILNKGDLIDDDTVVKARGLPWQSSEQDITNFFRGLNVARGGVALCLSQQGRRNGEALVRFESPEQRCLALKRHKHHLGQRYIEVYKATGRDFLSVAGGGSREAQAFLSHQSYNGTQIIVRMRGLPYSCKAEQVIQFFNSGSPSAEVLDGEEGVLFVHQADGRATGDAFVLFATEEEANKALTKHKQLIGTRYIELFKSTTAEVQQVLNRSMDPRSSLLDSKEAALITTALFPSIAIPHLPGIPGAQQQMIPGGSLKDCVRLRGLPLEAQVGDIIQFLGELSNEIICQGVHLIYKAEGTPSGEAFIQMNSEVAARSTALSKNSKTMFLQNKKRIIEVIQCSGDGMMVVLNNGLSDAPLAPMSTAAATAAAAAANAGLLQAYWSQPNQTNLVSRNTVGLQTRPTLIDTSSPFISSIIAPNGTVAPNSFLYPSGQFPLHASLLPTTVLSPTTLQSAIPTVQQPHMIAIQQMPLRAPAVAATAHGAHSMTTFQPILYWYPSPPVSPKNAYYVPISPTSIAVKGLPQTAQAQDVITFFDGTFESPPDVQLQRGPDGRPTGDAIVTFLSRAEADRAISDRNRQIFAGNRVVEVRNI